MALKQNISLYQAETQKPITSKARAILKEFLRKFGLEFRRIHGRNNYIGDGEKALAIVSIAYAMETRPTLCLSDFNEQDRREILKFFRNKVYCALLSNIDSALLFDNIDLELQRKYKALRKDS